MTDQQEREWVVCPKCRGSKFVAPVWPSMLEEYCNICNGRGGWYRKWVVCPECDGDGIDPEWFDDPGDSDFPPCPQCHHEGGWYLEEESDAGHD